MGEKVEPDEQEEEGDVETVWFVSCCSLVPNKYFFSSSLRPLVTQVFTVFKYSFILHVVLRDFLCRIKLSRLRVKKIEIHKYKK